MDVDELLVELRNRLDSNIDLPWLNNYTEFGSYRPDSAASAKTRAKKTGPWLTIMVDIAMSGSTMDQTTDRAGGDPYSAYVHNDWIGLLKSAPKKVTKPEELDEWSIFKSRYVREYTDVGVWGVHSGTYVTGLDEDGTLTIREASGRFQDVDPEELTTEKKIKLKLL
ncbi:MAG: hypothetical protein ACFFF4_08340 [Candidatus Thorarchaeota archaeon]